MVAIIKSIFILAISGFVLFVVSQKVKAVTPTITPIPLKETRIECTTGPNGNQVCQTVTVERVASGSATPTATATLKPATITPQVTTATSSASTTSGTPSHQVVNTGIQENIMIALIVVFALSSVGFTYSKVRV